MNINRRIAFSQINILIAIFSLLITLSAFPVIPKVRFFVYKAICNYYNTPPRWAIVRLFDNYAETFEKHLTEVLEYNTPLELTKFLDNNTSLKRKKINVLDLGCGTGLLGQELNNQFILDKLIGVDISKKMLLKNKLKNTYTELYHRDLLEYLQNDPHLYDLIAATDVFNYVGDLKNVMQSAYEHLSEDGYFAFSVEALPIGTFKLMNNGRFQHSLNYLQTLSAEIGFNTVKFQATALRKEYGEKVHGYLIVMQK